MNTEQSNTEVGGPERLDIGNKVFCRYIQEMASLLPISFCKVDSSNQIECCSRVFKETIGFKESELLGLSIFSLFKDQESLKKFVAKIVESKDIVEAILDLKTKQKGEILVKLSARAVFGDGGVFNGYLLALGNVEEERGVEEEIRRRVEEREFEAQEERERVKELEKVLEIRVQARTRELQEIAQMLERKARKRTEALEEKTKELESRAQMEEGSRNALLNLAEDLEEASKKAQEEKDKTLSIVDNFADGLLFFNRYKELDLINPQGRDIFGIVEEDVLGKRPLEIKEVNDGLEVLVEAIGENIQKVFRKEMCFKEKTFFEVTSVLVQHDDKEIGSLVIIHDITREKGVEKMKTEFVSLAAHQLRTPLAGIKWSLGTILEEKEGFKVSDETVEIIEKAFEANERMVTLVNDLLNVTRIEEGNYACEAKETTINEIIDVAIDGYKDLVESRGLQFRLERSDEEFPPIKADIEELSLVVSNFFDNALKYTKEGEICLKIESLGNGEELKITVIDTGVGVPQGQKEKMFEKFFRAENVQLMDTEGSGLGLFISKNIVEAHGGEIGFESEENKGSLFFFTIPTIKADCDCKIV